MTALQALSAERPTSPPWGCSGYRYQPKGDSGMSKYDRIKFPFIDIHTGIYKGTIEICENDSTPAVRGKDKLRLRLIWSQQKPNGKIGEKVSKHLYFEMERRSVVSFLAAVGDML